MRRWLLITLAIILPALTAAETVTLRSGEHADFSRLVAFLPGEPEWTVVQEGRAVSVTVSGAEQFEFDTSAVFDRIPKTRITAVGQPGPNRLMIDLACDCGVTSFFQAPRMLVIDVADPADTTGRRGASQPDPVPPAPKEMRDMLKEAVKQRTRYSTTGLRTFAEALAAKTTRGVLDLGVPDAARPEMHIAIGSDFKNIDVPNLAVPNLAGLGETARKPPPTTCDALARAPLGRFTGEVDFAVSKAKITARLYTENLALDGKAAIELAQLYLSQGFGAEARQAIRMSGDRREGAAFLARMAALIDDPDRVSRAAVEPFENCDDDNVLWPVIAGPLQSMAEDTARQVVRSAETLPRPLLHVIASPLITNLVESGQPEAADMIARIIGRSGEALEVSMANALLAEDERAKEEILENVARSNREEAAEATALLVERRLAMGEKVSERLTDLVASHAEEQRHGDAGAMLRKAEAFSLISRGEFVPALAVIKSGSLDAAAHAATVAQFFRELARSAETVTFLKIALSESALAASAPDAVRQSVAARLYENKFSEAAQSLVDPLSPLSPDLLANALSARLFGDVGIPDDRLFAEHDPDPEADEARYHALLFSGRFAEARQVALGLGRKDPVDAMLALEDRTDDTVGTGADADLSLARANALTATTSTLAQTVTDILEDPALALDE